MKGILWWYEKDNRTSFREWDFADCTGQSSFISTDQMDLRLARGRRARGDANS